MLAIDLEVRGINDAGAGSPRNYLLSLSFADLEIVIEKSSWVDRQGFAVFSHILNCEIREFNFLAQPVFHSRSVRALLFRCGMSAAERTDKS